MQFPVPKAPTGGGENWAIKNRLIHWWKYREVYYVIWYTIMNLLGIVTAPCIFKGSIEDEKSNRKLTTRYVIGVAHVSKDYLSFLSWWRSILQGVELSEGKQRKWVCNIHLAGFVETCRNLPTKSTAYASKNQRFTPIWTDHQKWRTSVCVFPSQSSSLFFWGESVGPRRKPYSSAKWQRSP